MIFIPVWLSLLGGYDTVPRVRETKADIGGVVKHSPSS